MLKQTCICRIRCCCSNFWCWAACCAASSSRCWAMNLAMDSGLCPPSDWLVGLKPCWGVLCRPPNWLSVWLWPPSPGCPNCVPACRKFSCSRPDSVIHEHIYWYWQFLFQSRWSLWSRLLSLPSCCTRLQKLVRDTWIMCASESPEQSQACIAMTRHNEDSSTLMLRWYTSELWARLSLPASANKVRRDWKYIWAIVDTWGKL